MLETILINIAGVQETQLHSLPLFKQCLNNGINCFIGTELPALSDDLLIITDAEPFLALSSSRSTAVLGISNSNHFLKNVEYAAASIESVDLNYARLVYNRFHNYPLILSATDRLYLRELSVDDIPVLIKIFSEPMQSLYNEFDYDVATFFEKYEAYIKSSYKFYGYGFWGVYLKSSLQLIGICGIQNTVINGEACIELGYLISNTNKRNGYAYEAAKAALELAFTEFEVEKLVAKIRCNNIISAHLAKKLGMKYKYSFADKQKIFDIYQTPSLYNN